MIIYRRKHVDFFSRPVHTVYRGRTSYAVAILNRLRTTIIMIKPSSNNFFFFWGGGPCDMSCLVPRFVELGLTLTLTMLVLGHMKNNGRPFSVKKSFKRSWRAYW